MAHQVDTLVGRVALVTGANRGIGRAIALELARLGAATLVGGRDGTLAAEAAEEIRSEGLDAAAMAIDVTDDSSVLEAKLAIERAHGRLDMLVNNAAIKLEHHPSPPSEAALDDVLIEAPVRDIHHPHAA